MTKINLLSPFYFDFSYEKKQNNKKFFFHDFKNILFYDTGEIQNIIYTSLIMPELWLDSFDEIDFTTPKILILTSELFLIKDSPSKFFTHKNYLAYGKIPDIKAPLEYFINIKRN